MRQSLLSPGGKEHMRRLMSVIRSGRVTLSPIIMHRFKPDDLKMARDRFRHQRDGVARTAITPGVQCIVFAESGTRDHWKTLYAGTHGNVDRLQSAPADAPSDNIFFDNLFRPPGST